MIQVSRLAQHKGILNVIGRRQSGLGLYFHSAEHPHSTRKCAIPHYHGCSTSTRLFGSKRGVPGNPPGTVAIYNDQTSLPHLDEAALEQTVQRIAKLLGYETYDVTLLLVDDEEMKETNYESRGINAPTDILSFPFHAAQKPGLLEEPEFDIPDYYTLGDMMVCVPYVIRRCQEDAEYYHENDDSSLGSDSEEEDRGVSGAMAHVKDPEQRIRMLLVHGMLHLVGYDHEEDDEFLKELGDL
jgi:rRNA maturation RNase YbeY